MSIQTNLNKFDLFKESVKEQVNHIDNFSLLNASC